jgi:hypothetical protein
MYTNKPLFPGKNPHNQLELILNVVGYPFDCKNKISDDIIEILDKKEKPVRVNFNEYFKEIPDKQGLYYHSHLILVFFLVFNDFVLNLKRSICSIKYFK